MRESWPYPTTSLTRSQVRSRLVMQIRLFIAAPAVPQMTGLDSWRSLRMVRGESSMSLPRAIRSVYQVANSQSRDRSQRTSTRWKRNQIECLEGCHGIRDQQVENPGKDEGPCDRGVFTEGSEGAPSRSRSPRRRRRKTHRSRGSRRSPLLVAARAALTYAAGAFTRAQYSAFSPFAGTDVGTPGVPA